MPPPLVPPQRRNPKQHQGQRHQPEAQIRAVCCPVPSHEERSQECPNLVRDFKRSAELFVPRKKRRTPADNLAAEIAGWIEKIDGSTVEIRDSTVGPPISSPNKKG